MSEKIDQLERLIRYQCSIIQQNQELIKSQAKRIKKMEKNIECLMNINGVDVPYKESEFS